MRTTMGSTRCHLLLLLSLLAGWVLPVYSLDPKRAVSEYGVDAWSTDEGLPQSSVTGVVQGPQGYLWVATLDGVARFDGIRFQPTDLSALGIEGNQVITALEADADGRLWAGTLGGSVVWTTVRDSGRAVESLEARSRVWVLHQETSGPLWIGSATGLARLDHNRFVEVEGLADLTVQAVTEGDQGVLWIGTSKGLRGLAGGKLSTPLPQLVAPIRAILQDHHGSLWLGTTTDGLYRWQDGVLHHWTTAQGLPHDYVNALLEDRDGKVWIATRGGLVRFEDENTISAALLPTVNILALLEDSEGSLWLGTQTAGLNRLRSRHITPLGRSEGLADEVVSTVTSSQGETFIGTTAGGLHRLSSTGLAIPIDWDLPSRRVLAALATDDALWIATDVALIERRQGSLRQHHSENGLPSEVVLSLFEDREGRLWAGTNGGGVGVWDGSSWQILTRREGLVSDTVYTIAEDLEGAIWLGTQGGLTRLDGKEPRSWTQEDGLSSNLVVSLHADERGVLWAGTFGGGLARIEASRLATITKEQGLYDDTLYSLLADESGGLWICSNRGVFRVDRNQLDAASANPSVRVTSHAFDRSDGMPASECNGGNQPAATRLDDGRLAFATLKGLALLDPSQLAADPHPPAVAIEELRADGRSYGVATPHRLEPGVRHIEIDYTALTFLNSDRSQFRYRLVGYDVDWTEAGTRRTAFFTGLTPRDYRLEVVASGRDGIWGTKPASLSFSVAPYFWQTRWFPVGLVLLLSLMALSGHRWRLRQLRSRQYELEQRVAERTDQLAEANRKLALLAAQDGLTGLANHRTLQEHLRKEWRRGQRDGSPLSFLLLDLDSFKLFNDTYGHQAGDECLRRVSRELAQSARRPGDLAARYGGEEFAVVLPATGAAESISFGEQVRHRIEQLEIPHQPSLHGVVTVSIGAATVVPDENSTVEDLIAAADSALYRAKAAGRNQIQSGS